MPTPHRFEGLAPGAIPIYPDLESLIERYLGSRAERFPAHDLGRPATPLFVATTGKPMTPRQVEYLIEALYVRAIRVP